MNLFHFKQAGVFHLQRLHMVSERTGMRYKSSNQQSLNNLIVEAFQNNDEGMRREFVLVYNNCWPATQQHIATEVLSDYSSIFNQLVKAS